MTLQKFNQEQKDAIFRLIKSTLNCSQDEDKRLFLRQSGFKEEAEFCELILSAKRNFLNKIEKTLYEETD